MRMPGDDGPPTTGAGPSNGSVSSASSRPGAASGGPRLRVRWSSATRASYSAAPGRGEAGSVRDAEVSAGGEVLDQGRAGGGSIGPPRLTAGGRIDRGKDQHAVEDRQGVL